MPGIALFNISAYNDTYTTQHSTGLRYRFSLLIQELRGAETHEYAACVLAFINCIISGSDDITRRVKLRNELIGNYYCYPHAKSSIGPLVFFYSS